MGSNSREKGAYLLEAQGKEKVKKKVLTPMASFQNELWCERDEKKSDSRFRSRKENLRWRVIHHVMERKEEKKRKGENLHKCMQPVEMTD